MATALPVIATQVGGNGGLLQHGVTGLLVPAGNPDVLAEAIGRLAEDRAFAARLGEQARSHAQRVFGMDRMVARTEELYFRSLADA
jgi:glycosyltransferase involved in cell wall biosynthesis